MQCDLIHASLFKFCLLISFFFSLFFLSVSIFCVLFQFPCDYSTVSTHSIPSSLIVGSAISVGTMEISDTENGVVGNFGCERDGQQGGDRSVSHYGEQFVPGRVPWHAKCGHPELSPLQWAKEALLGAGRIHPYAGVGLLPMNDNSQLHYWGEFSCCLISFDCGGCRWSKSCEEWVIHGYFGCMPSAQSSAWVESGLWLSMDWRKALLQQVMHRHGEEMKQAHAIELSKIFNMTTAIVRTKKSILAILKGIISHAGALELQYGVRFMKTREEPL